MKKLYFYLFAVGVFLFFSQTEVSACSCMNDALGESLETKVKAAKDESKAVFTGKVLSVIENKKNYKVFVKIRLLKSFKGSLSKVITIQTGTGGGDCGFNFRAGSTYLVYARESAGKNILSTNNCTRTAKTVHAKEELKLLENGIGQK